MSDPGFAKVRIRWATFDWYTHTDLSFEEAGKKVYAFQDSAACTGVVMSIKYVKPRLVPWEKNLEKNNWALILCARAKVLAVSHIPKGKTWGKVNCCSEYGIRETHVMPHLLKKRGGEPNSNK